MKSIFHHFRRTIIEANKKGFLKGASPTLRYYKNNQDVSGSKPTRKSAVIWLSKSQL